MYSISRERCALVCIITLSGFLWSIYPYDSGSLHYPRTQSVTLRQAYYCPGPVNHPWSIWVKLSCAKPKQHTAKWEPCMVNRYVFSIDIVWAWIIPTLFNLILIYALKPVPVTSMNSSSDVGKRLLWMKNLAPSAASAGTMLPGISGKNFSRNIQSFIPIFRLLSTKLIPSALTKWWNCQSLALSHHILICAQLRLTKLSILTLF